MQMTVSSNVLGGGLSELERRGFGLQAKEGLNLSSTTQQLCDLRQVSAPSEPHRQNKPYNLQALTICKDTEHCAGTGQGSQSPAQETGHLSGQLEGASVCFRSDTAHTEGPALFLPLPGPRPRLHLPLQAPGRVLAVLSLSPGTRTGQGRHSQPSGRRTLQLRCLNPPGGVRVLS